MVQSRRGGQASDDIQTLIGRIVVSPEQDGKAQLWLKGDLAAGKNMPANPKDGWVLTSMVAGAGFEPATFGL